MPSREVQNSQLKGSLPATLGAITSLTTLQPGLPTGAIIGIAVAGGLLLLALAAAALWIWHTRNREEPHKQHRQASRLIRKYSLVPPMCQQFSLGDMEQATNNWAEANLLGPSPIFALCPPSPSALLPHPSLLLTPPFPTHQVTQMATKHHPNLVRLLGFCIDVEPETAHVEQILVYEFVPNGDLEKRMAPGADIHRS
ncbi:unnamed protein product [Closterium sp. NIES-64]|nr:unnamed protein product [Closterium sp. NIES-64]